MGATTFSRTALDRAALIATLTKMHFDVVQKVTLCVALPSVAVLNVVAPGCARGQRNILKAIACLQKNCDYKSGKEFHK